MNNFSDLSNQKILITGGLGFIGSNLAHKCLDLGAKVTVYDCLDPRSGGNLHNIQNIKNSIELVYNDILHFDWLSQHVVNKDIVFNCAASTSHPFSMKEPWIDLDVNSKGVINLLEAIRRSNREVKLVHIGTTTQLGKLHYQPADEHHPEFPMDMYSANKMVAEKYVLLYAKAYSIKATVIRLPNVIGPRAAIHSSEFTFNNYFIGLALQNKSITVYTPGTQLRNVLYVDDAVDALITAAEADGAAGEAFFAAGKEHYSVKDIAEKTCEIIGGAVEMVEWPKTRKVTEIGDAIISNNKINKILKWTPVVTLEEGLMKAKEYYEDCLDKYIEE